MTQKLICWSRQDPSSRLGQVAEEAKVLIFKFFLMTSSDNPVTTLPICSPSARSSCYGKLKSSRFNQTVFGTRKQPDTMGPQKRSSSFRITSYDMWSISKRISLWWSIESPASRYPGISSMATSYKRVPWKILKSITINV